MTEPPARVNRDFPGFRRAAAMAIVAACGLHVRGFYSPVTELRLAWTYDYWCRIADAR